MVNDPLTIWWIGDGKPGHQNQSLGLAEAIGRLRPCEVHHLSLAAGGNLLGRLRRAVCQARSLPRPDLILAAGHATHLPLLWLSWRTGAKSVVLMRPSLPVGWFDLCLAPEHDFATDPGWKGLVLTRGAINRVAAGDESASGKLVLVGGPSKTHAWDPAEMREMLRQVCADGDWELTDSRRTPEGFTEELRRELPGVKVHEHGETGPDWLPSMLQRAGEVWVTEDSVSMIYEALTSGARVGLLPVPRRREGARVLLGVDRLVADGFLTRYERWITDGTLQDPPHPLREADRCAEVVSGLVDLA